TRFGAGLGVRGAEWPQRASRRSRGRRLCSSVRCGRRCRSHVWVRAPGFSKRACRACPGRRRPACLFLAWNGIAPTGRQGKDTLLVLIVKRRDGGRRLSTVNDAKTKGKCGFLTARNAGGSE